jgi:hypothetical protein
VKLYQKFLSYLHFVVRAPPHTSENCHLAQKTKKREKEEVKIGRERERELIKNSLAQSKKFNVNVLD